MREKVGRTLLLFTVLLWRCSMEAVAETAAVGAVNPTTAVPMKIMIRPAREPRPALKYRLVPERMKLVAGNAAIFYHRALQLAIERGAAIEAAAKPDGKGRKISTDEQVAQWIEGPISEIPLAAAQAVLDSHRYALNEVELGAGRASCDWEFDLRREGFSLLLPEIQQTRTLARLVALRARVAIRDGKTDEAMRWIEIGLVMGRHVSHGPIAIQALVGIAIDSTMARCLEEVIRAPGTPSLYWALADRPRPFVDVRYALEGEKHGLEREIPVLSEVDRDPWSLEQARRITDQLQRKLFSLFAGDVIPGTRTGVPRDLPVLARQLGVAAVAAKIYPAARRSLISQGRAEADVEAMPVVQVALLYSMVEYQDHLDERFKWMMFPYWQSYKQVDRVTKGAFAEKLANPFLTMFEALTPALNGLRLAACRLERQLDALQCIEAIRLYAAGHDGALPATLEQLTEAPVPNDPVTGKPFVYEQHGDTATLFAPIPPGGPDHPSFKIQYKLELAR